MGNSGRSRDLGKEEPKQFCSKVGGTDARGAVREGTRSSASRVARVGRHSYMDPARVKGGIADAIWNSVAVIISGLLIGRQVKPCP